MWKAITAGAGALMLAGCATGAPGSSRRMCYDAGFQPGTAAFTNCWQRIRDQQFATDLPLILGITAGVAAGMAANRGRDPIIFDDAPRLQMAPDGSWVFGRPRLAPDGRTWIGSVGNPTRLPDGRWVSGSGSSIMCPNGLFVIGKSCRLAPDGSYVGVP